MLFTVIYLTDGRQQAQIIGNETYVYNLGTFFLIDKVLFTETSDVLRAMEMYQKKKEDIIKFELEEGDGERIGDVLGKEVSGEDFGGESFDEVIIIAYVGFLFNN